MATQAATSRKGQVERPIDTRRKAIFLRELAAHGVAVKAAKSATPHSKHSQGGIAGFRALKRRDLAFSAAWDAAQAEADANLLAEARRRAVEGSDRGLYFKGERIYDIDPETGERTPASEKVYSDRLMELLLKSRFPDDFVERRQIEHRQAPKGWHITSADLAALTEQQIRQLEGIVDTIMTHRGEIERDPSLEAAQAQIEDAEFSIVGEEV